MAYVIGDSCISCGSCEGQCPVGAISMGEGKFEIDAAKCVDCGPVSHVVLVKASVLLALSLRAESKPHKQNT